MGIGTVRNRLPSSQILDGACHAALSRETLAVGGLGASVSPWNTAKRCGGVLDKADTYFGGAFLR